MCYTYNEKKIWRGIMVSDEFKKMIREESIFKIERRIPHLRSKMKAYENLVKAMSRFDADDKAEKEAFEEACDLYKEYKEKLHYCIRVVKLRRNKEKREQGDSLGK